MLLDRYRHLIPEQPQISAVRITELDFLLVSSADLQFPTLNRYFRDSPPSLADPFLLDFLDFQIAIFNLQLHSSSNIFSSIYADLQTVNSASTSTGSESFYVNPVTNQLISDFSIILDSFRLTKQSVSIASSDFQDAAGNTKQQVTLSISFSVLTVQITHHLPDFRAISIRVIPGSQVRSFDAKLEVYFQNVRIEPVPAT